MSTSCRWWSTGVARAARRRRRRGTQRDCHDLAPRWTRVSVASLAKEALAALDDVGGGLKLLVTDVVMPGMSGVELAQELKRRLPALKVLLLSGYPGPDSQAMSGEPGVEYLAKPVTPKQLLDRIDQLLGST